MTLLLAIFYALIIAAILLAAALILGWLTLDAIHHLSRDRAPQNSVDRGPSNVVRLVEGMPGYDWHFSGL